jgi:uncharacterized membrane protein YkoI
MSVARIRTTSIAACLVAGVLALSSAATGRAAPRAGDGTAPADPAFSTYAGVSMDQAIQMAERQFGAKVVRASVSEDNGRRVYVLRLVSEQGRVWTVRVDAASGAMM